MKVINLGERSSVLNSYMAQLRDVDVQTNRTLFRRNMQRVARAIAYSHLRPKVHNNLASHAAALHYFEQNGNVL